MKKISLLLILSAFIAFGCNNNQQKDETQKSDDVITQADKDLLARAKVIFKELPTEAANPDNRLTDAKVRLGKILYYDNRLSKDETQSCNTCHDIATYGVDNLPTSPGDNGIPGTRNSPTVFNAAFKTAQFWDGRNKDVEEQAGGPILNPAEMAIPNEQFLIDRLEKIELYKTLFAEAYPEDEAPITYTNIRHAIAAFERILITPAPFDDYLAGDVNALNDKEKKGLETYINQGCNACHSGSLLGGTMLQKFAVFGNYWEHTGSKTIDYGKYEDTKVEADKLMFYVPMLRNIEKTAPYFHDGSVANLGESIRIMAITELNKELTEEQVDDIVAFMKSLTGDIPVDEAVVPVELAQ